MIGCCHGFWEKTCFCYNGRWTKIEVKSRIMIEDLPIEVISRILKYFDSDELISMECEKLPPKVNEALKSKSLWNVKTLRIKSHADYKQCMSNLQRIQYCEKVSFAGSQIHRQQMAALLGKMKRLRCLSFEGFLDLCDAGLQAVIEQHGAELRVLDLTGCQYLTNFCISKIAAKCKKLHTLIVNGCSFSSAALEMLADSEAMVNNLRCLDISRCYLMDTGAIVPLSKLAKLQVLKLQKHEWLNAVNLPHILAPLLHIRQVDIRDCEDFTRSSIEQLKRSLPNDNIEIIENAKLNDDSEESIRHYLMALISAHV